MANAAAKKAAAAKSSTAGIYKPLLLGSNALYILLLVVWNQPWGISFIFGMLLTWGLQIYAYLGILDQAANYNLGGGASNKKKGGNNNKNDLIGGVNLDLLALTIVIQYGTAVHSTKWYWLIMIVPTYGGYTLYQTYYGSSNKTNNNNNATTEPEETSEEVKQRREKRAEKRRQKWS